MKGTFVKSQFSDLPQWAKGLIGVVVVGTVIFVGYKVYKNFGTTVAKQPLKEEERAVDLELDKLISSGQKPKLAKSQHLAIANKLFTAMDGWGSDDTQVKEAIQSIPTYPDLLAVISAYGIRKLSTGKWNPSPEKNQTLVQALNEECSSSELADLNKILASKKISYKF